MRPRPVPDSQPRRVYPLDPALPVTPKRVLVVWWSQSGQLRTVAEAFAQPFSDAGHEVAYVQLEPTRPFPFPWKVHTFFGEFPETVLLRPGPIERLSLPPGEWDLVVLASQIWFLSPSQPFTALMSGPDRELVRGKRVITLISCRNMWVRGWRRLVGMVEAAGGTVTDRIVATHSGSVFASYFTTLAWMLTGKRDAIKALPAAGLGAETFVHLAAFGRIAALRLAEGVEGPLLAGETTAGLSYPHAFGEQAVGWLFPVFGAIISAVSRPGTVIRNLSAVALLCFILSTVIGLFVPCVIVERLFRRWIDPWLDRRASLPVS